MRHQLDITARLHRRLLEIVRTAIPLLTSSIGDADLVGLAHLREEMVEALNAYCRHVHKLGDKSLIASCTNLQVTYDVFRERWVHRDGIEHWYEYRLSSVVMMKQIRLLVQNAEAGSVSFEEAA